MKPLMYTGFLLGALMMLAAFGTAHIAAADGQLEAPVSVEPYGTFNGIAFVRYKGFFAGETSTGTYRVPYEIVAPEILPQGNGRILFEPPHFVSGTGARENFLTPSFLFERGFSHASVGYGTSPLPWILFILDPDAEGVFINGGVPNAFGGRTDDEIIADYARALREDPVAVGLVGDVEQLYSIGFSNSAGTLHRIVHAPFGVGSFDLTFLVTLTWDFAGPHTPVAGTGRIIVMMSESEFVRDKTRAEAMRIDEALFPFYRSYEVAGAPHIPCTGTPRLFECDYIEPEEALPPINWTPALRALFVVGDDWVHDGVVPPPSIRFAAAASGEIDPVYNIETGIARDENNNALGGIRMPDLTIGRAQFMAVADLSSFPGMLAGDFVDLKCEPLPDGSVRFKNHGAYVSAFNHETNALVADRLLLQEDAIRLRTEAAQSDVGKPGTCDEASAALATAGGVGILAAAAVVTASEKGAERPTAFALHSNYPNPFNPATTIRFSVSEASPVKLVVFDVLGRQVRVLVDGVREAGTHEVVFEAGDLPSGTYLYRLETSRGSFVRTMLVVK